MTEEGLVPDDSYHLRHADRIPISDLDPSLALVSVVICSGINRGGVGNSIGKLLPLRVSEREREFEVFI